MPVFNGARHLPETLACLGRQTFTDFEIIIVDDGSTDDTPRILAEFARSDQRCRVITQANKGQVAARNLGVGAAKAPLIAWLDADDIAEKDRFARQVDFLRTHPQVAAVGSAITLIDQDGVEGGVASYPEGAAEVAASMSKTCALAHSAVMMRKAPFLAIGGYRQPFLHAEDYDLWLRLLDHHDAHNLREPLLRYRQHGGSVSFRHRRQQSLAALAARHCTRARRAGRPDPFDGRKELVDGNIFAELAITPAEEAVFRFECLASCVADRLNATMDAWIIENLDRSWELRAHLPRGRYARRCLAPFVHMRWKEGNRSEALRWLGRALMRAPFACLWQLAVLSLRRPPP
jgi:glycosyltransferase involved in cell wall biosynthesis